ncbi:hypothetical protein ACJX0J_007833, partial [Zea mays]
MIQIVGSGSSHMLIWKKYIWHRIWLLHAINETKESLDERVNTRRLPELRRVEIWIRIY